MPRNYSRTRAWGCAANAGGWLPAQTAVMSWCPKYRRKKLVGDIERRLRELLYEKASQNNWEIKELEIMPDYVHLFIKATPSDCVSHIVSQLKGYTANMLRKEFESLRRELPTLWTRSFYVESVGHISEQTIIKYIENQKNI